MAQKKTSTTKKNEKKQSVKHNKKQNFFEKNIRVFMLVSFGLFLLFSVFTFVSGAGIWTDIRSGIFSFFGIGLYLFDILLLVEGIFFGLNRFKRNAVFSIVGSLVLVVSFCSFVTVSGYSGSREFSAVFSDAMNSGFDIPTYGFSFSGGIIGGVAGGALLSLFGKAPAAVITFSILIISAVLAFDISTSSVGDKVAGGISKSKDKIDKGKTALSDKHVENKARRSEERDVRAMEREAEREKRRLDELEERRRRIQEQNAENQRRKGSILSMPEIFPEDFLAEKHDENITKDEEIPFLSVPDADNDDNSVQSVSSHGSGRSITGRASIDISGETFLPGEEPIRVIKGKPFFSGQYSRPKEAAEKKQPHESSAVDKAPDKPKKAVKVEKQASRLVDEEQPKKEANVFEPASTAPVGDKYLQPPIDCLEYAENIDDFNADDEMRETADKLIDTLNSFNVETHMVGASRGPSVTRYELQPAPGVRINKITNLADDIALNLASAGIRIEAPIPGKSAVGIEVPNKSRATVSLREIISSPEYEKGSKKSKLNVAIGKDIAGQVNCADLAKMPHLLVAGTTGSGKSVTMNDMIVSLLYNASPDEVKILLIDPKQVEFSVYNGIPHLYVPVISDAKKASGALTWAVTEMERRYKLFSICGVRDLASYNKYIKTHPDPDEIMHTEPQVVIFIDELADLMMVSPKEVEDAICRLAQKARAAGMHLVVATQRPSVDVVTGLIKANIPSRLALSVSSQIDSRTILDTAGAEKLLGNGDLLFNPLGVNKPIRIQGAFVSDDEIERIVDFLRDKTLPDYDQSVMEQIDKFAAEAGTKKGSASADSDDMPSHSDKVDSMFDDVLRFACETGEISGSLIMRKFSLGYGRSAKIIDQLMERGYLGEVNSSTKKRPVLLTIDKYWEMKNAGENASENTSETDETDSNGNAGEESGQTAPATLFDEPVNDEFDIFDDE